MLIGRPIYLHFLDRELAKASSYPLKLGNALRALNSAVYATISALFVGYSLLWESEALSQPQRRYVQELCSLGVVASLSSYSTVNEFLDSRHSMYRHVALEYPMYFHSGTDLRTPNNPSIRKDTHTTNELTKYFEDVDTLAVSSKLMAIKVETLLELNRPLNAAIRQREGKAITYNLFASDAKNETFLKHEYEMRRMISYGYTKYYLNLYPNSTILYGIEGLSAFDSLAVDYYLYDSPQLSMIHSYLCMAPSSSIIETHPEECALYASYLRGNPIFNDICNNISTLLASVFLFGAKTGRPFRFNYDTLTRWSNPYSRMTNTGTIKDLSDTQAKLGSAYAISGQILNRAARDEQLSTFVNQAAEALNSHVCDILLVAVNKIEIETICRLGQQNSTIARANIYDNAYIDLGIIGENRVLLVACRAGSMIDGGSYSVTNEAIKMYRPHAVICVGIAMGLDRSKDNIGDVIISNMIVDGDYKRVGYSSDTKENIIISRGERVNSDEKLVNALLEHSYKYSNFKTLAKPIITGSELEDYPKAASELINMEPEARGYEMEGYGVYKACKETMTSWVVVKGISDWGDGGKKGDNEEDRQRLAANNAVLLVIEAISKGVVQVRSITEYAQRILPIIAK
jgi:nucleoside phosphorylase